MKLPATATLAEARGLAGQLGEDTAEVDAGALTAFDSSAIALLLEARRRAVARGQGFRVRQAPPKLKALAKLYGVDELLSFAD